MNHFRLAVFLAAFVWVTPAQAIVIDFNAGYSADGGMGGGGSLHGQPSTGTHWAGGAPGKIGSIAVTPNDGADGKGASARTQPGSDLVKYTVYTFPTTDTDLGYHFDPASSVINYSFKLKLNGTTSPATVPILRISFGQVVGFEVLANGVIGTGGGNPGGKPQALYCAGADGKPWHAPSNAYFTISGTLNYATKKFTASVDGVPQNIAGSTDLNFVKDDTTAPSVQMVNLNSNIPDWMPISIADIELSATGGAAPQASPPQAPEPVESAPAAEPPAIADGVNIIKNPSFENPETPSSSYYWIQNNWAKNEVEFALDPDNPHSGKVSQRISLKHAVGDRASLELNTPPLPVRPGMSLKLSFWTRGPANALPLTVQIRKAHPPYKTYFQADVAMTDDWHESTFNMVLPSDVDERDTIMIFNLREENTYWLDDVTLTPFTPVEKPPLVGNQVKNGSFEVGRDHWYAGSREAKDQGKRNDIKFEVQPEDGAPNGKKVLAMNVPAGCQLQLTSAYFPLRANHPVSVRFWMKTPAPAIGFQASLGTGHFPNQILQTKSFSSTDTNWNFYHFTVTPVPSASESYFLFFDLGGAGQYEIDGVSVTEGDSAEAVYPAPSVPDVGWGANPSAPAGNIFWTNDKISFPLEVAAPAGTASLPVKLRLVDYREQEVKSWNVTVLLDAQGEGQTDVTFPSDRLGAFKVEAYLNNATPDNIPDTETIYTVVPKLKPMAEVKDSFYGGHCMLTPYNLDIAERLGIRWLRLHPPLSTKWMAVEPEKGKWDFYTAGAEYASKRGFHILSLFDTAPWYDDDAPDEATAKKSAWFTSYAPKNWDDWRTYVQKTATAFGPYIQDWEIWNEPDGGFLRVPAGVDKPEMYVKILTETRQALDEGGFHFNLIGNCVADINRPFTMQELKLGGGSQVDALSFHLYIEDRSPDEKRPPLVDQLEAMRKFPNRSGKVPELWYTEGGIWLDNGRSWLRSARIPVNITTTIEDSANTCARTAASLKALGVQRYFFYGMFAESSGGLTFRSTCGMIDIDGCPHAAGAAYAASVYFLEDAAPDGLEVLTVGKGKVTLAKFHKPDSHVTVLWTRTPMSIDSVPNLNWKGGAAFDMMGNPVDLTAKTQINNDPIYLITKS